MKLLSKQFDGIRVKNLFYQNLFGTLQKPIDPINKNQDTKLIVAPTPPLIHNYFSADYEIGAGYLVQKNNWMGNPYFKGFIAFDKEKRGVYFNMHEDQDENVPFQFMTSVIASPNAETPVTNYTSDYVYLSPGRCWELPPSQYLVDIPLHIPSDASYNGTATINGKSVQFWTFSQTEYGYSGEARVAVESTDVTNEAAVVFVNLFDPFSSDQNTGIYFKFKKFDPSRPKPAMYAPPPPPCTPFRGY